MQRKCILGLFEWRTLRADCWTPSPQLTSPIPPRLFAPHTPAGNLPLPRGRGSAGSAGSSLLLLSSSSSFLLSFKLKAWIFVVCFMHSRHRTLRSHHPLLREGPLQAITHDQKPHPPFLFFKSKFLGFGKWESFQTQFPRVSSVVFHLNTFKCKTKRLFSRHFHRIQGDCGAQVEIKSTHKNKVNYSCDFRLSKIRKFRLALL